MTLQNGLFHKDIGLPIAPNKIIFHGQLVYSNHAKRASNNDRYGKINLPKTLNTRDNNCTLIELEVKNGKPTKGVYRIPYCASYDLIIVLLYDTALVKTVWLNSKADKHTTLQTWKYDKLRIQQGRFFSCSKQTKKIGAIQTNFENWSVLLLTHSRLYVTLCCVGQNK